jgi:fructose-1,6-bisphosphatase/inositol monophosphatase family enzyme
MAATLPQLLTFAHGLADEARSICKQHFRNQPEFELKPDRSPVTVADRAIERALRQRIAARFPDHGVLGEEEGATRPDAEWVWALDPIDGTKAFVGGNPLFGSLIGLLHKG